MTDIDWSKAPEWATVFIKGTCSSSFYFEKTDRYERDGGIYRLKADDAHYTVFRRPWCGEGLPPVGTVCEMHHDCWQSNNWPKVTIKYASSEYFITEDCGGEQHWHAHAVKFRPIRTPEQIAADERMYGMADILKVSLGRIDVIGAAYLYDAGYRKP